MGFLKRVFGRPPKPVPYTSSSPPIGPATEVARLTEREEVDTRSFTKNAARTPYGVTFIATEGEADTLDRLRKVVADSDAGRVFVIGGLTCLSALTAADFAGYEVLVNRNDTFGWLLSTCEYLQGTSTPAVVVSKFPRRWEKPQITLQVNEGLGVLLEPYHGAGGTIETATAPPGMTLRATPAGMNVAFCFVGMAASSYYSEVLHSQGCPPRQPKVSIAIIDLVCDAEVDTPLIESVRRTSDAAAKDNYLREFAAAEEKRCSSEKHGTLRRTFTGGIMQPGFHSEDVLPPGALTPGEIAARKSRGKVVDR